MLPVLTHETLIRLAGHGVAGEKEKKKDDSGGKQREPIVAKGEGDNFGTSPGADEGGKTCLLYTSPSPRDS